MSKLIDLTGKRFSHVFVIKRAENAKFGATMWLCKCDCGKEFTTYGFSLRRGWTKSCGCFGKEAQRKAITTHGMTNTPLYRCWDAMKRRCMNPSTKHYERYGGRGISVCDEWKASFESFRDWAFANGYKEGLSIDRIDNNGNYCPENCRWANSYTQAKNKRNNVWITFHGTTMILSEWARMLHITPHCLWKRLKNHTIEEALTMVHEVHIRKKSWK